MSTAEIGQVIAGQDPVPAAIAPPAAIANALADALVPFAPRVNEIPLTPDRVLQLLTRKEVNVEAGTV